MSETPEAWFHSTASRYVEAQIMFHLGQTGVLEVLSRGVGLEADELARECSLRAEVLAPLLDYLANVSALFCREGERFHLTPFGRAVLERYGVRHGGRRIVNMFDTRVGAYGPVWSALGSLLRGDAVYGRDVVRAGEYSEDALFKLAAGFVPTLRRLVDMLRPGALVELGPTSGLLQRLGAESPSLDLYAVDRKRASLDESSRRARAAGVDRIEWIESDIHDIDGWMSRVPRTKDTVFVSCHFHEFLAVGEERMRAFVRALAQRAPGAHVLAIEQPLLTAAERDNVSPVEWLQAHNNVLIHHLIANARLLTADGWAALFEGEGCRLVRTEKTGCFGMVVFDFEL